MHYVSISDLSIYSNWLYWTLWIKIRSFCIKIGNCRMFCLSKHEVVKLKSVLKNAWLADADISED